MVLQMKKWYISMYKYAVSLDKIILDENVLIL